MKYLPCSHLVWYFQSSRNNLNIQAISARPDTPWTLVPLDECLLLKSPVAYLSMGWDAPLPIWGCFQLKHVDPWSTEKMAASDCSFTTWDLQRWEIIPESFDAAMTFLDHLSKVLKQMVFCHWIHAECTHSFPKKQKSKTPEKKSLELKHPKTR